MMQQLIGNENDLWGVGGGKLAIIFIFSMFGNGKNQNDKIKYSLSLVLCTFFGAGGKFVS